MTTLPSLAERNAININHYEQAILWSANLLFAGFSIENDQFSKNIIIEPNSITNQVQVSILVPIDYQNYWSSNANFIKGTGNFYNGAIAYTGVNLPNITEPNFIEPSSEIDTVEKYYLYSIINYQQWLIDNNLNFQDRCTYSLNLKRRAIETNAKLSYQKEAYRQTNDLLLSLNVSQSQLLSTTLSRLTNSTRLTNSLRLTN